MILGPSSESNDEQHRFCPKTPHSWCKYQRDQMTNTNNYEHKWLPTVLDRLFSSEILSTYQSGLIQNQNKYLNSVVWAHCPKRLFCSVHRYKIAVSDKVSQFNDVAQGKYYLFKILNLTVVDNTKRGLPREQRKRLNKAPTKVSAKHK